MFLKFKNMFKMALGMAACCLVPVLLVLVLSVSGFTSGSRIVSYIAPFLCPLMMLGMMLFMGMGMKGDNHKGHSCCGTGMDSDSKNSRQAGSADTDKLLKIQ